jgi:hypothetical protein
MTEHLPECIYAEGGDEFASSMVDECICDRLRACEKRVREREERGNLGDRARARREALDAARGAVEACRDGYIMAVGASPEPPERYWIPKAAALAAIDALRSTP